MFVKFINGCKWEAIANLDNVELSNNGLFINSNYLGYDFLKTKYSEVKPEQTYEIYRIVFNELVKFIESSKKPIFNLEASLMKAVQLVCHADDEEDEE